MKKTMKNNNAVTPVMATIVVLLVVTSVSTAVMVWGGPHIDDTRLKSERAMISSQIGAIDDSISNIIYNVEGTKSINKVSLDKDSYIETDEKTSRTVLWYSLDQGYNFDVDLDLDPDPSKISIKMETGRVDRITAMLLENGRTTPCFLEGTQVLLGNGFFKNIEDMVVGDYVLSYYDKTNEIVTSIVTNVFHHDADVMTDYYLVFNEDLCVTPNHLMYTENNWVSAGDLEIGDCLFNGKEDIVITSVSRVYEKKISFDLGVAEFHNYFVKLDDDVVLVHNEEKGKELSADFTWEDTDGSGSGTTIHFDGSISTGEPVGYRWDFGDGNWDPSSTEYNSIPTTDHTYADNSDYTCTLEIIDKDDATASTFKIVHASTGGGGSGDILIRSPPNDPYDAPPWKAGSIHDITWTWTEADEDIKKISCINTGTSVETIMYEKGPLGTVFGAPMADDEKYEWCIDGTLVPGTYYVRLEVDTDPLIFGESSNFVIEEGTPSLYYTPKTFDLDLLVGTTSQDYSFYVSNGGTGRLYYSFTVHNPTTAPAAPNLLSITSAGQWVDVTHNKNNRKHVMTINTNGLAEGELYTGTIDIDAGAAGSGTVTVTVNVKPEATLDYSLKSGYSTFLKQGDTEKTVFFVWNKGLGYIEYVIEESSPYIEVSPTRGFSFGEHDPITLRIVNTGSLSPGLNNLLDAVTIKDVTGEDYDSSNPRVDPPDKFDVFVTIQAIDPTFFAADDDKWDRVWWTGAKEDITWANYIGQPVNIYLYKGPYDKDQQVDVDISSPGVDPIATGILAADGGHEWKIPYHLESDNDYWIKLTDSSNENELYGRSRYFTIESIGGYDDAQKVEVTPPGPGFIDNTMGLTTVSLGINLENVALIELWDDSASLDRPIGRIWILDSDSIKCTMPSKSKITRHIIENGGSIISDDKTSTVKFSPVNQMSDDFLGLHLIQLIKGDGSYQSMSGGNIDVKVCIDHVLSYARDSVPNAFFIKLQVFGENKEAWENYFIVNYGDKFEKTGDTISFTPSSSDDIGVPGVSFTLLHSIVKFSLRI